MNYLNKLLLVFETIRAGARRGGAGAVVVAETNTRVTAKAGIISSMGP